MNLPILKRIAVRHPLFLKQMNQHLYAGLNYEEVMSFFEFEVSENGEEILIMDTFSKKTLRISVPVQYRLRVLLHYIKKSNA